MGGRSRWEADLGGGRPTYSEVGRPPDPPPLHSNGLILRPHGGWRLGRLLHVENASEGRSADLVGGRATMCQACIGHFALPSD